jgi:hypothetical protein
LKKPQKTRRLTRWKPVESACDDLSCRASSGDHILREDRNACPAGRLTIDNGPAEQAIRPLAIGRKNWLHLGGDGALRPTAVLLSVAASAKRHGVNPWVYLKHALTELPALPTGTELTYLLPDVWARSLAMPAAVAG